MICGRKNGRLHCKGWIKDQESMAYPEENVFSFHFQEAVSEIGQ
jgi:hypothetical protein